MNCPACRNPMMVMEFKKIELDYCANCKGVWFDNIELDLLMKSLALSTDALLLKNMLACPESLSAEKRRKCPICNKNMKKVNVGAGKNILIDVCQNGHGIWFDGGELPLLISGEAAYCGPERSATIYGFLADVFQHKG
jgi:uncharacterized protein